MAFGIAEAIASISAAMQAIDLFLKYGGTTREQVIQTLDLEYAPSRYEAVEQRILGFGDVYKGLFDAAGKRAKDCIEGFKEAILDDQLPHERAKLGLSAKSCVCKQIKILKDFMGDRIPEELQELWRNHECEDLFGDSKRYDDALGGSKTMMSQQAGVKPI